MKDGGPAFPIINRWSSQKVNQYGDMLSHREESADGMSLRDWFAGRAVGSRLFEHIVLSRAGGGTHDEFFQYLAECTYRLADAMLKEREKETQIGGGDRCVTESYG